MSGRLAILVGRMASGKLETIDVAEGRDVDGLLQKRSKIIGKEGSTRIGGKEVQLSEILTLANGTAGGELKPRRKFNPSGTEAAEKAARKAAQAAVDAAQTAADKATDDAEKALAVAAEKADAVKAAVANVPGSKEADAKNAADAKAAEAAQAEATKLAQEKLAEAAEADKAAGKGGPEKKDGPSEEEKKALKDAAIARNAEKTAAREAKAK